MSDDKSRIPDTGSKWATVTKNGTDLPRSARADVYKGPLKLGEFERHIREKELYAPLKQFILETIAGFRREKEQERGR